MAELESQIRAHAAGEPPVAAVYPHPIAFNALPEIDVFLPNGYTKEEWKVVTENRKILRSAGPPHQLHGRPGAGLREPLRGDPRRDPRADQPGAGARAVRRGAGGRRPGRPGRAPLPAGDRGRRPRRDLRRPDPAGPIDRRRPGPGLLGRVATTCARAPRRTRSSSPRSSTSAAGSRSAAARGARPYRAAASDAEATA